MGFANSLSDDKEETRMGVEWSSGVRQSTIFESSQQIQTQLQLIGSIELSPLRLQTPGPITSE